MLRLEPATQHDALTWGAWLGCWLLFLLSLDRDLRSGISFPIIPSLLAGLTLWLVCWWLSPTARLWHFLWIGYLTGAGRLIRNGWLQGAGLHGERWAEAARWTGLGLVCGGILHPYLTGSMLGGGDAQGYYLQLADCITQMRSGVFPVLVGQTAYAFNGDIHPLRTAPGLFYAAGLLDGLTLRALTPVALQNLLVILAGFGGAFGTYLALSRHVPGQGWTAWILAVLFITSPGILAPLFSGDMIATWMTLPWLPWLLLALVRMADEPLDPVWPVHAVGLLAAIWWFHAPIGFWCSICALPFGVRFLLAQVAGRQRFTVCAGLAGLFVLLAGYVFSSVITLELPTDPNMRDAILRGAIRSSLAHTWDGFLRPVSQHATALLSDLQLSPALWLALLLGVLGVCQAGAKTSTRLLIGVGLLLVALLLPVSDHLWRRLPDLVLFTTEKWPAQRFFPILSALAPFLALPMLAGLWAGNRRLARDLTFALIGCCLWSLAESWKFVQRGHRITHSVERSRQLLIPGNAPMSRYAHEYYGRLPRDFSSGPTDPQSRLRLLHRDSLEPILTNATSLLARTAPEQAAVSRYEATDYGGRFLPALDLKPGSRHLLHFDFHGRQPEGVIQISGRHVQREYRLPDSGEEWAFGVGPGRDPTVTLWHASDEPDRVEIKFIGTLNQVAPDDGPELRTLAMEGLGLPLKIEGLVPLRLKIDSPVPAWLETPRLHVPGYQAVVNGTAVPVAISPDGLIMLSVPAGATDVELFYPGPFILRPVFWLSVGIWTLLGLARLASFRLRLSLSDLTSPPLRTRLGGLALGGAALALTLAVSQAALVRLQTEPHTASLGQTLRLTKQFTLGQTPGTMERIGKIELAGQPLDLIAVYTDGKQAQLGIQTPHGAPVLSKPFSINYLLPQKIEIRPAGSPGMGWEIRANHRLLLVVPAT